MEAVLDEAPPLVTLEVLEQNEPAIRLYEASRLRAHARPRGVVAAWSPPLVEVRDRSTRRRSARAAYRGSARMHRCPADYERDEVDGGAVLARGATIFQLDARDEKRCGRAASRAGRTLQYVNVPEGDAGDRSDRASSAATLDLRQFEMALLR